MSKIRVSSLPLEQIHQLKPMLEKNRHKPNRFLFNDLKGDLDSFWLNEIADLFQDKQVEIFVAMQESKIVGMVVYADLPWETRIFGKKMGALKYIVVDVDSLQAQEIAKQLLSQTIHWATKHGIDFLLCKTDTDDTLCIHAMEREGFYLMDTMLDYVYDFRKFPLHDIYSPPLPQGAKIRLAQEDDLEELVAVAHASFREHFGRFHVDERISKRQAVRVYEEWIKSSWGGYADWIFVAEINKRIAGYSVWRKTSFLEQNLAIKLGHYSIGTIHPDYYGYGFFSALTYSGMKVFEGIVDCIEGPTHTNNYKTQWAYNKLCWRICGARHSFHKWLTE